MPPLIEHEHSTWECRHQQHLEFGPLNGHQSGQFYARHPRHLEVRQKQVYVALEIDRLI